MADWPANPYFGEPWDVPATENAHQAPAPIGTPCGWCQVPIAEGDRGFLIPCSRWDEEKHRPYAAPPEPWHRECLLRSVVGSPAHMDGGCDCYKPGDSRYKPQTPEEVRAEAVEVWDRLGART